MQHRYRPFTLIIPVSIALLLCAPDPARADVPAPPPPSATNLWFDVGEEILYTIYWGFISVGYSHVTTDWFLHDDGRTLLRIRFESRSNKVLASLYPVEDFQEVLIDPESFLPVVYTKKSRQGRRHYHEITRFDHAAGVAHWESVLKEQSKTVPIRPDTRDLITLMYYFRSMKYDVGSELHKQVFTDEKIYDLTIRIPKKEIVELSRYGRVASLLIDPEASFEGLFVRKGKGYMWVSDDARRICTKITAQVPVASVRIQIDEVRGPGEDFWVGKAPANTAESAPIRRR